RDTVISNTTFHAVRGSRALDISDGGLVTVEGGAIIEEAGVENPQMIGYAPEGCRWSTNGMTLRHVKIVGRNPHGEIANFGKCPGAAIRLIGVSFEGSRPALVGNVIVE